MNKEFNFASACKQPADIARHHSARSKKGMSLAAVLGLGTISLLWVTAMATTVMGSYQQATISKSRNIARTCAETAMDQVIADMNRNFNTTTGTTASPYDAPTLGSSKESQIDTETTSGLHTNTTVSVYNRFPGNSTAAENFSTLYDATLDSSSNSDKAKYYRIVESKCRVGICEKVIRTVLEPMFTAQNSIVFPYAGFGDQGMTVIGRNTVDSYHPAEAADALRDKLGAHLGSNVNTGHVGQNYYNYMTIGGNQYEFPNPVSSQTSQLANISSQFNATLVSKAKWCQYYGSVYSNGSNTAHWPAQPNDFVQDANPNQLTPAEAMGTHLSPDSQDGRNGQGIDNVRGLNNVYPAGHPDAGKWLCQPTDVNAPLDGNGTGGVYAPANSDGISLSNRAVETMMDYKKVTMVPSPSAPSGTHSLGAINLSDDAKVIFRTGAPSFSGEIGNQTNGTLVLPPGDYTAASMALSGNSQFIVESGNVNLFVEGASGSTMLTVAKTASLNNATGTLASGLKVFSSKNSDIIINGSSKARIYAPNARIFIGSGSNSSSQSNYNITNSDGTTLNLSAYGSGATNLDFWGAVAGRETYFLANPSDANSAVRFHYDRSAAPANFQYRVRTNGGAAPTFGQKTFAGWRAVSYQEDPAPLQ